ncbi:MAG: hypothetical protein JO337_03690 [Acidimicrobiales bacterium]|nr:hypothetical protein [Acidimicrobiales bacterium]
MTVNQRGILAETLPWFVRQIAFVVLTDVPLEGSEFLSSEGDSLAVRVLGPSGEALFATGQPVVLSPKNYPALPYFASLAIDCGWTAMQYGEYSIQVELSHPNGTSETQNYAFNVIEAELSVAARSPAAPA